MNVRKKSAELVDAQGMLCFVWQMEKNMALGYVLNLEKLQFSEFLCILLKASQKFIAASLI